MRGRGCAGRPEFRGDGLCLSIEVIYKINAVRIRAKNIILDFRMPNVERFVQRSIEMFLNSEEVKYIDELIVLNDNAA